MAHVALGNLETGLAELMERYRALMVDNLMLRRRVQKLEGRQTFLVERNHKTVVRVEHIISQLRDGLDERNT